MDFLIGVLLALAVGASASGFGLDRDRAFYPTMMIVIASYYALFAAIAGSPRTLAVESLAIGAFLALSLAGFKRSLWWVVGALLAHGVFDFLHRHLIPNPGVPAWWPAFCLAYDGAAALYLGWLLASGRVASRAR